MRQQMRANWINPKWLKSWSLWEGSDSHLQAHHDHHDNVWHGLHWATVWIHCGLNSFRIPCSEIFWKPNPWFLWPLQIYTSLHWLIDDLIMVLKPNFILCFLLYQEVSTDWRATNFINSHSDCIFPIALLLGLQNIDKIKILWNYSL